MVPSERDSLLIIDSWPVMEWFVNREPAASHFQSILSQARDGERRLLMSIVNMGEVFYTVAKLADSAVAERTIQTLSRLKIETASIDDDLVWRAAKLKAAYPISYADAFAAALAIREGVPILTGDSDFLLLRAAGSLQVEWAGTTT